MGEDRMIVGKVDDRGVLPLIEMALAEEWSGGMQLKRNHLTGTIWTVKGQIVHADLRGKATLDGLEAFEAVSVWREGEYILKAGFLPPARSIRIPTERLLSSLRELLANQQEQFGEGQRSAVVGRTLLHVFDGLRERVPGLESLSLVRGTICEATTSRNIDEMDWMDRQLKSFFAKDHDEPDTLFVQEGDHALLILKSGSVSTVLSARTGTAPEALFWAGTEAQRRVLESANSILSPR